MSVNNIQLKPVKKNDWLLDKLIGILSSRRMNENVRNWLIEDIERFLRRNGYMSECDKAKIIGYVEQTPKQIEAINLLKEAEIECVALINVYLNTNEIDIDKRWMAIAKTHIQQGFMAAVRAVARPNGD